MFVYVYIYMHICVLMYSCAYVCTYVYMHNVTAKLKVNINLKNLFQNILICIYRETLHSMKEKLKYQSKNLYDFS